MCAASVNAEVQLFVDDADAWRTAISEPLTEIDWYPHWLPDGDTPLTTPIPVDYYSELGLQTGLVDPADPDVIQSRLARDATFQNPSTPPFYIAVSTADPDPSGAHIWFASPVRGFQTTLPGTGSQYYGFFPTKFYLDGVLVGEIGTSPVNAYDSLGVMTDFDFDQIQAIAQIGRFEFPTLPTDSDCSDIDGDGEVGVDEVLAVIAAWNTGNTDADVNNDGIVDTNDLLQVLSDWGLCS